VTGSGRYIVGLTGGIGSGKSAAAARFAERGAEVVDTDAIAHELTGPGGSAITTIATVFGPGILTADGALDRVAMRQRVFADPAERQRLEAILHPMIRAESDRRVAATLSDYVILMVPLLVESGDYRQRVQRIAVVDCQRETQIQRVMARNGMSRDDVERILAVQASREQRLAVADDVIDNDGCLERMHARVDGLDAVYRRNRGILSSGC
jgi:dephospho-CoA kinase